MFMDNKCKILKKGKLAVDKNCKQLAGNCFINFHERIICVRFPHVDYSNLNKLEKYTWLFGWWEGTLLRHSIKPECMFNMESM